MSNTAEAIRIEGNIPVELSVDNSKKFLFISKDQRAYTHGIHKYPAKFFPELPRWIIRRFSRQGDLVLDPFTGSGTTNLEASLLGRRSIGVDIDPFSRFIAKVKTTPLPPRELIATYNTIRNKVEQYREPTALKDVPEFPYRDNWFKPFMLKELAFLKSTIKGLNASGEVKDFFLVCFSSIIRAVSEADNNCTRTVIRKKLGKRVERGDAIRLFLKRAEKQVEGMCALSVLDIGEVVIPADADARNLAGIRSGSVDLALTSPPYLNAVDYPRTHQLEMYWLGLASGSLQPLKSRHVGTEVVRATDYGSLHLTGIQTADTIIRRIYDVDRRRAFIATKYLRDMRDNLQEVYRVLKPGSRYVMVVGNNLVRGIEFETWRYMQEEAPKIGYKVECCFISAIINHFIKVPRKERINDDHILILSK